MDYFSELLDSYSRLKKRTFKLTYINEAEEKKPEEDPALGSQDESDSGLAAAENFLKTNLTSILAATSQSKFEQPTGGTTKEGEPISIVMWQAKDKNAGTAENPMGVDFIKASQGYTQFGSVADIKGVILGSFKAKKSFSKFISLFVPKGEKKDSTDADKALTSDERLRQQEAEMAAAAEQERIDTLFKLGGAFMLMGRDSEEIKSVVKNLQKSSAAIRDFCSSYPDAKENQGAIKNICRSPGAYIGGISKFGFEYKLAKGKTISYDPDTGEQLGAQPISSALLLEITDSHAALTNFLTCDKDSPPAGVNSCNCAGMSNRVGFLNEKLVLFGSETTQGVVFKPNSMQELAASMMFQKCGSDQGSYTNIVASTLATNTINTIKGTFNELILQAGVGFLSAKTPEEKHTAFSNLAYEINKKRSNLLAYAKIQEQKSDIALGLDEAFDTETLLEQAGIASDPKSLQTWFLQELKYQWDFLKLVDADGVLSTGKEVLTGDRADTKLLYKDENKLREVAKFFGIDFKNKSLEKDPESGMFVLGVGQKRQHNILDGIKQGEINSIRRQKILMSENASAQDKNLKGGFFSTIRKMQFPSSSSTRFNSTLKFYEDIENTIEKNTEKLTKSTTYSNNGSTKLLTPSKIISNLTGIVKESLSFSQLQGTPLGKAMFNLDGSELDFSDPIIQKRLAEVVQRTARFKMYNDALKGDDPDKKQAARDALIRASLISGANDTPIVQLVTIDAGKSFAVNHNEAFEAVCKANNDNPESLEVKISGFTVTFTTPEGISYSYSQERSEGSDGAPVTRSLTKMKQETLRKLTKIKSKSGATNESTLHKYLEGQKKLLEVLLNQTK